MSSNGKTSNWFKYWFNTPYYHSLYGNRDESEANKFIINLHQKLGLDKDIKVLDLACGKGRHALALNQFYNSVTGIDISENSILEAQKINQKGLEFYTHDMRNTFRINYFDLVTNLFTSFGYFEKERDNIRAMETISKGLKSNGTFVIDFLNANKVIKNLVKSEVKTIENIEFKINREYDGKFIRKHIRFSDKGQDFHFTEQVEGIKLEDFKRYFKQVGLRVEATFGNYDLDDFQSESSNRLIIIAKKI